MTAGSGARATLRYGNVALRALMELGIVGGFGSWGFHVGRTAATKVALGIGAPLAGFGVWALVDFRSAGAAAEWLRMAEELVISGLAAGAWCAAGQRPLGVALALVSVVHHALVYLLGDTLLHRPRPAR